MQSVKIMSKQPEKGEWGTKLTISSTSIKTVQDRINATIDSQTDKN